MYNYLFGPVPSRRLGMSLGVDLVPRKVCSLDCVYCEVGKTSKLSLERKEYIPYDKIVSELEHYFQNSPEPDYITFSGSGEPSLNSRIGDVLEFIKKKKPHIPIAVLTNGSLLYQPEVRRELLKADVVLPSLDAGSKEVFQKINAPAKGLIFEKYVQGLQDFRAEFSGKIWLEVFILPDYNMEKEELLKMEQLIARIKPDSVQLNTLDRPGTVPGLRSASKQELTDIIELWNLEHVEIIASAEERKDIQSYRSDTETAILETISRRPCTNEDLSKIVGLHINEINKYLDVLEAENKISGIRQERGVFYQPLNK